MIQDELSARAWMNSFVEYDAVAAARLDKLITLLNIENARQNLVSAVSLTQIWQRHIADSAQLLLHVPRGTGATWLDLGAGAGFPGLVIAILRPDIALGLVESRPKRCAWLRHACRELELPHARVIESRLELIEMPPVSVISARAFAPLDRLLKLSARFSDETTFWLLPKGRSAAHELRELSGWQHLFHVEQSLTDCGAGLIVGQLIGKTEHNE